MKMVSAAKLKKAQDAITAMRPYSDKLTELLQSLSATLDADSGSKFALEREVKRVLLVPITSNRGLAGAFNSNIIKETLKLSSEDYLSTEISYLTIGKKANDAFKKTKHLIADRSEIFDDLTYDNASKIAQILMDTFVDGKVDKVVLVYNKFKNAATQEIMTEQFLPIVPTKDNLNSNLDYIFEPSKAEIVEQLIPKSLKTQLFKAIRDSFASEHGARMTAMHKATDNATELRDQLKLTYNKARQASITNEILEIVGGAEALNN